MFKAMQKITTKGQLKNVISIYLQRINKIQSTNQLFFEMSVVNGALIDE